VPELPEVETIRRQLSPLVVGRRLVSAWAFPHPKFTPALDVEGASVDALERRGKYLLFSLDDDRELVVHLGMTGSLRVRPPADQGDAYVRATWALDTPGGDVLEYRDVRRFGRLAVAEGGIYAGTLAVQGPDALDLALGPDDLWRMLRRSRRAIKTQLLSQRPIAGLGNIYADEALWRARIHPARRSVTRRQAEALLTACHAVLHEALDHTGTTLRDYRTPNGESGRNQFHLDCYGRAGLPCHRCGTLVRRMLLDARSTTWCPTCQPR
jgi:formamidopyrimidine-DNA glycosylase